MNHKEIAVKMVLAAWQSGQERIQKALSALSDEDMDLELASGRNKVSWVIGHLAAVNDYLFSILEVGEKINEAYCNSFFKNDFTAQTTPSNSQIKAYWQETSSQLNKKITTLSADDWFKKHAFVSTEDFAKEPHRNKLNVLLTRSSHLQYHLGQLTFVLKSIEAKKLK